MSIFLPPVVLEMRAKATELFTTLGAVDARYAETVAKTEAGSARQQAAFRAAGAAGKAITLGVLGAGVVIAGFSVEAAAAAQVTEAKLSVAVKNAGGNMQALQPKIEKAQAAMRSYGFSNNDAKDALGTLTTALKDPQAALKDIAIAADLARAKHIDLNQAALLVAKTQEGQVRGLKSLGIDLPVAAASAAQVAKAQVALATAQSKANAILAATPNAANAASKAHKAYQAALDKVATAQANLTNKQGAGDQLLAGLKQRISGAADAYGKTFAGQLTAARSAVENLGEKIGGKLIPVIQNVIKWAGQMYGWFVKNKGAAIAIGVVLGVVAGSLMAIYIAQKAYAAGAAIVRAATLAWAAIQWILNAAMDANPIGLIILAVAALIAIVILLVTHWKQVTKFLGEAWKNVGDFFKTVGDAIVTWWNGFWSGIIGFVQGIWKGYINGWLAVFKFFHDTLINIGTGISNWWNGLWSGIVKFVQGVWKGAADGIIGFLNHIIDAVNGLIGGLNDILAGINKISGGTINLKLSKLPHIPSFDVGGIVPGSHGAPTLIVAHGGEPILSDAMMAGRAPMPPGVESAVDRNRRTPAPSSSSTTTTSKVIHLEPHFHTNASVPRISSEIGWLLRRHG